MSDSYTELWDLDPETIYLNHGSFGPSPRAVCAAREEWSRRLERQPMRFFCQQMEEDLDQTATALAGFLHTKPERLALIDNATWAMNVAAESIDLKPGDEVLLTDHEYGAVRNIWQKKCQQAGARVVTVRLPFPLDEDGTVEAIAEAVSAETCVIVVSHVTSPTAAILPVQRICSMARQRGILSVVDGPHAVAMLDLFLDDIGCDFYCASCHKWLSAAFGSGFLWVHPRHHGRVRCPVISWGGSIAGRPSRWQDRINWVGTRDPAAMLSVSAAITFMERIGLATFRKHAHSLIRQARSDLLNLEGTGPLCTTGDEDFVCMCAVELPQPANWTSGYHGHPDPLQLELRDQHGIEIPVGAWNGHRFIRLSAHLYNTSQHMTQLLEALGQSQHLR